MLGFGFTTPTLAARKAGLAATPASLGAAAWYAPSDISTLYQDAAASTAITEDGTPVGAMLDKSGNGLHVSQSSAASRPVYHIGAGRPYITFDGVDDFLACVVSGYGALREVHIHAQLPASLTAPRYECLYGARSGSTTETSYLANVRLSSGEYQLWGAGGSSRAVESAGVAGLMGTDCVLGYSHDGSTNRLYVNGVQVAQGAQTTVAAGTVACFVGALNAAGSAASYFSGNIYGLSTFDRILSEGERNQLVSYMVS